MLSRARVLATVAILLFLGVLQIHADAVDAFLAKPLPTNITAQAAKDLIKQAETLAAQTPPRRLELEAYVIPLRRLFPFATADNTAAIKPKLLLLVDNGTSLQLLRAQSFSVQGNALIVIGMDGQRSVWQQDLLKKQLSWYSDADLASGSVDVAPLIPEYEKALGSNPGAPAELKEELAKLRKIEKESADNKTRKQAETATKLDALLAQTYTPEKKYTSEELAHFLVDAEAVRADAGSKRTELDKKIGLFRLHFLNILSDMSYEDGTWWTAAQRDVRQQTAEERARFAQFVDEHKWPLDGSLIPSSAITYTLAVVAVVLFLILFKIIQNIFSPRTITSRMVNVFGLLFVLGSLALLGLSLAAPQPELIPVAAEKIENNPAVRLLYLARQKNPAVIPSVEEKFVITDQDVNALFQHHVSWNTVDESQPTRTALTLHWVPNGVQLQEKIQWKTHTFTILYIATVKRTKDADYWRLSRVQVGKISVPDPFSSYLWENLNAPLTALITQPSVGSWYRLETIENGKITTTALFKPSIPAVSPTPAAASPPPASPSPAPAATSSK